MQYIDILNLEWPSSDRDLHIVTPSLVYLHKKYKLSYKTKSIFNGYYYLLKYKPKMLIMSNFQGAGINNDLVSLAYDLGIKVITFISEGNVMKEDAEQFLWGHNNRRKMNVNKMLVWSDRSREIFVKNFQDLDNKIISVGGTGFDRYKLLNFKNKSDFLQENNLKYKKIIGIAAWGFDLLFGNYYNTYEKHYLKIWGQKQVDMHRKDLVKLQKIYKQLIENNQDILFILRYHPGTIDFEKNEFYTLDKYSNVFISNKFQNNQYQISDLISISDLWIGYETTTALESWLLTKQTFLINPTTIDFVREMTYIGSPIVKATEEVQHLIDEFFNNGTIKSFENLKEQRNRVIKDVIEYGDGKNYIRAAKEIMKIYNQPDKEIKFNFKIYKETFKQILKLILSKTIFLKRWPELNYKSNFAKKYQDMYGNVINV
jgi:surface carbohydrate biosynthesis protein